MKHSTGKPTKAEQERFRMLLDIGCIACAPIYNTPEIHHLLSGNKRRGHMFTIPLCPWHHRGYCHMGIELMTKFWGPSLAHGSKKFRERFGTDDELLAKVNALIAERKAA